LTTVAVAQPVPQRPDGKPPRSPAQRASILAVKIIAGVVILYLTLSAVFAVFYAVALFG
jgi:hypothetical protein